MRAFGLATIAVPLQKFASVRAGGHMGLFREVLIEESFNRCISQIPLIRNFN